MQKQVLRKSQTETPPTPNQTETPATPGQTENLSTPEKPTVVQKVSKNVTYHYFWIQKKQQLLLVSEAKRAKSYHMTITKKQ